MPRSNMSIALGSRRISLRGLLAFCFHMEQGSLVTSDHSANYLLDGLGFAVVLQHAQVVASGQPKIRSSPYRVGNRCPASCWLLGSSNVREQPGT